MKYLQVLDFFIFKNSEKSKVEIQKLRVFISILLLNLSFTFSHLLAGMYGHNKQQTTTLAIIVLISVLSLALTKYSSNSKLGLLLYVLGVTYGLCLGIQNTGMSLSYNIKWVLPIMALITFLEHRWLLPYVIAALVALFYFYTITTPDAACGITSNFILVQLVENITYIILGGILVYLFNYYLISQNRKLKENQDILTQQSQMLHESNKELERFAYIASHDIKSPLRNITSFTSLLERELGKDISPRAQEYLNYVKSGGNKLHILVSDVLDFSKVNGHEEKSTTIDLDQIIEEIKSLLAETITSRSARINTKSKLPKIIAQRTMILLVLKNLIENGIKYNQTETPTIEIDFTHTAEGGTLHIKDNGIGIEQQFQDKIFDMFSRLHTYNEYEGTGLGLAFCRKIMLKYGGHITIYSKVNEGSTFNLFFPTSRLEKV